MEELGRIELILNFDSSVKLFNKGPRGLDALLGHLLVKRMPVMNLAVQRSLNI